MELWRPFLEEINEETIEVKALHPFVFMPVHRDTGQLDTGYMVEFEHEDFYELSPGWEWKKIYLSLVPESNLPNAKDQTAGESDARKA